MTTPEGFHGPDQSPNVIPGMQAIALPTEHEGHIFKSRNEARFAVFFKALELPYEYETEGFRLSNGQCFLPDFYLPTVRFWAECKPTRLYPDEENKCRLLAGGTGFPCLFLIGNPEFAAYEGATWNCGEYTVVNYSLDVAAYHKAHLKERRLYSEPNYRIPPDETQFSSLYRHAVHFSRSYKFEGVR